MTATDRTHEPDETFRAVLDRIEGAAEAHPLEAMNNRFEGRIDWYERTPWSHTLDLQFRALGNPFRPDADA